MLHPTRSGTARRAACLAIGGVIALAAPARAQLAICVLVPGTDGELTLSGDLMSWRTTRPATISAVNVARVQLFVNTPTSWASAPSGTPATTFTTTATLSGANLGALLGGAGGLSAVLSGIGTTVATIALGADASTPFRAGQHVAQVTVTCAQ